MLISVVLSLVGKRYAHIPRPIGEILSFSELGFKKCNMYMYPLFRTSLKLCCDLAGSFGSWQFDCEIEPEKKLKEGISFVFILF